MSSPIVFAAALGSLLIYVIVARTAVRQRQGASSPLPRDYFLARHRYAGEEFAAAQIAYQLQMSTVYPFVLWAATGDWVLAVWNTIFYFVGIGLFVLLVKRFKSQTFKLVDTSKTVHSFIAQIHGSPDLRQLTAWMSVLAFAGLAVFEIVWGATSFKVLFGGSSAVFYLAIAVLSVYLIVYFWVGGQGATIRTDQYQLLLGYIGLHALVAWCVSRPSVDPSHLAAPFLIAWTIVLSCIMFAWRLWAWRPASRAPYLRVLNLSTLASVAVMLVFLFRSSPVDVWRSVILRPTIHPADPNAFPWQLATLALLPLFFQFVDMTNWQRIASLKDSDDLRKGLLQYLLESPLSWLLPVVIGMCLPAILGNVKGDVWERLLAKLCADDSAFGIVLASLVVVAVIAIFMSTAESLISAIGYTYAYDLDRRTREIIDAREEEGMSEGERRLVIARGRRAMAIILGAVVILFVVVDVLLEKGATLLGLFLCFYTPLMALAPPLLVPALLRRSASRTWTWVSLAGGSVVGVALGVASLFVGGIAQWVSAPVVFVFSWVVYLIGSRPMAMERQEAGADR